MKSPLLKKKIMSMGRELLLERLNQVPVVEKIVFYLDWTEMGDLKVQEASGNKLDIERTEEIMFVCEEHYFDLDDNKNGPKELYQIEKYEKTEKSKPHFDIKRGR